MSCPHCAALAAKAVYQHRHKPAEAKKRIDFPVAPGVTFFSIKDIWLYQLDEIPTTCDICRAYEDLASAMGGLNGNFIRALFPYLTILDENTIGGPGEGGNGLSHPNCVSKGTLVSTYKGLIPIENVKVGDLVLTHNGRYRSVVQLHKNWFEGELYNVAGNLLTGNHPVLTAHGWVSPDSFNSFGENVFYISSINLKSDNMPPYLFQKSLFSSIIFGFNGRSVPVSPVNLDSNPLLRNSEVNIKNIDSVFRDNTDSGFCKCFKEQLFKLTHFGFSLNAYGTINKIIVCACHASHLIMSRFNLVLTCLFRHLFPFNSLRFTLGSRLNPCCNKSASDGASADTKPFRQSKFRHSVDVEVNDFLDRQLNIPCQLSTTTITNIDKTQYKGFVYNLSVTDDESYTIGNRGLIVHNCRCRLVRFIGEPDSL